MKDRALVDEWLKKAHSNLERAKAGKVSEKVILQSIEILVYFKLYH